MDVSGGITHKTPPGGSLVVHTHSQISGIPPSHPSTAFKFLSPPSAFPVSDSNVHLHRPDFECIRLFCETRIPFCKQSDDPFIIHDHAAEWSCRVSVIPLQSPVSQVTAPDPSKMTSFVPLSFPFFSASLLPVSPGSKAHLSEMKGN